MRWADLDLLGHVNNVVYVDYLQEARVDMLRTHGRRTAAPTELAEGVVVVRHEVTYVAPLTFGSEPVSIECWVTEIRAASFTMAYEIFHEDERRADRSTLRATHRAHARTSSRPSGRVGSRPEERETLEPLPRAGRAGPARRRHEAGRATSVGHYPVHVRFSDVDVYGHVNNVKYFEYFQEARIRS